ncbi:MAG: hypothetical protein QW039_04595 [Fervidicoccaceae archaeon]
MNHRGIAEGIGVILLALMLTSFISILAYGTRHAESIIRTESSIQSILSLRRAERIVFGVNGSTLLAKSTIETEAVMLVVFWSNTVYYSNESRIPLQPGDWTLLPLPQEVAALILSSGNASLGIITRYGNFFVFTPNDLGSMNASVNQIQFLRSGVLQRAGSFSIYYVGNSSAIYSSYQATVSGTYVKDYSMGNVFASLSMSLSSFTPIWSPILIFYSGDVSITEKWNCSIVNVTVEDRAGGKISFSAYANGTLINKSTVNTTQGRSLKLFLFDFSSQKYSSSDVKIFSLPSGPEVYVVSIVPVLFSGSFYIYATSILDGSLLSLSYGSQSSSSSSYLSPPGNMATPSYIYAGFVSLIEGGSYIYYDGSFNSRTSSPHSISIELIDQSTLSAAIATINVATALLTDYYGAGYISFLEPPVNVSMTGFSTVINAKSWDLNRTPGSSNSYYQAQSSITFPGSCSAQVLGKISLSISFTNAGGSAINGPQPSPPPYIPTAPPSIYYIQTPMPMNGTSIATTVYLYAERINSNLTANYIKINLEDGSSESFWNVPFSIISSPIGEVYGIAIPLDGDSRYSLSITVLFNGQRLAYGTFYNYLAPSNP